MSNSEAFCARVYLNKNKFLFSSTAIKTRNENRETTISVIFKWNFTKMPYIFLQIQHLHFALSSYYADVDIQNLRWNEINKARLFLERKLYLLLPLAQQNRAKVL